MLHLLLLFCCISKIPLFTSSEPLPTLPNSRSTLAVAVFTLVPVVQYLNSVGFFMICAEIFLHIEH